MGLRFRARFYSATRAVSGWEKLSRNGVERQAVRLARKVRKRILCCSSDIEEMFI
jgi:hypothetical protein